MDAHEMNCIIKESENEGYIYKKVPIPTPKNDEVLIKVTKVAICGSDIALYKWNEVAKVIASLPFIPGHEAVGIVCELGPQSNHLKVGDRIAVENHFYCGECYQCLHNDHHICQKLNQYGHGKGTDQGGFSQFSVLSEKFCYKIQSDISDDEAVLMEPMGVAHNAIERLDVHNEELLVIGCGPVGLLAIVCAKAIGASKIIAADISDERLKIALSMGANMTVNPKNVDISGKMMELTNGDGIGRICEASGNSIMLNNCFTYLRKGGQVSIVGLPKQPLHVENPLRNIVFKSLTIHTVHGRKIFHTWKECEKIISNKKVDITKVITHKYQMSNYQEAFRTLLAGEGCKIVVDPQV